jgi:hypothetical protein
MLIKPNKHRFSQKPIYCVIPNLNPINFENNSYMIMCFCFNSEKDLNNFNYKEKLDNLISKENFGGMASIFNMRGEYVKIVKIEIILTYI